MIMILYFYFILFNFKEYFDSNFNFIYGYKTGPKYKHLFLFCSKFQKNYGFQVRTSFYIYLYLYFFPIFYDNLPTHFLPLSIYETPTPPSLLSSSHHHHQPRFSEIHCWLITDCQERCWSSSQCSISSSPSSSSLPLFLHPVSFSSISSLRVFFFSSKRERQHIYV